MIYKPGGKTKVWNTLAQTKIIDSSELDSCLAEGWLKDPAQLFDAGNNMPEQESGEVCAAAQIKKRSRAQTEEVTNHEATV